MKLMRGYLEQNYHVYADNFFSSFPLVNDLLKHSTYYCGTIRKTMRGFPAAILDGGLMVGESKKFSNGEVMVCRWHDKRDVLMISTNNSAEDTQKPRNNFLPDVTINVPNVVTDYNRKMGGVDHMDQMRSYYNVGRTGKKW